MATRVSQKTIDDIRKMGMQAALRKYSQGSGDEEFNEAVRRFYGSPRRARAREQYAQTRSAQAEMKSEAKEGNRPTPSSSAVARRMQGRPARGDVTGPAKSRTNLPKTDTYRSTNRRGNYERAVGDLLSPRNPRSLTRRGGEIQKQAQKQATSGLKKAGGAIWRGISAVVEGPGDKKKREEAARRRLERNRNK